MPFDNPAFETDEILKDLQHIKACVQRRWFGHEFEPRNGHKAHCLYTPICDQHHRDSLVAPVRRFMMARLPSPFRGLAMWNNEPGRTKAEVIAFLDSCIAARQQELAHAL